LLMAAGMAFYSTDSVAEEIMNRERRKQIYNISSQLSAIVDMVDSLLSDEEDALGNMPENLEGSDRYTMMEEAVENLEDAKSSLEEAIEYLDNAAA